MNEIILKKLDYLTFAEEIKNGNFNFTLDVRYLPYNPSEYILFFRFPKDSVELIKNMSREEQEDFGYYVFDYVMLLVEHKEHIFQEVKFELDFRSGTSFLFYICKEPLEPNKQEKIKLLSSKADMRFNETYKEEIK